MKAPILPTSPTEPDAPLKSWTAFAGVCISLGDSDTLQSLYDAVIQWGTKEWQDGKGYYCRATGQVSAKDISFEISRNDYDSHEAEAVWSQPCVATMSDEQFAKAMARYNDITWPMYHAKLAEYNQRKAQYDKDMIAYAAYKEERQRAKDLRELERLQRKLGKTL